MRGSSIFHGPHKLILLLAFFAPIFAAEPTLTLKQGEVLRIPSDGATAEFLGNKFPIFDKLALVPAAVTQQPGTYPLVIRDRSGKVLQETKITVLDGEYPRQNIRATKQMQSLTPMPGEREAVDALKRAESPKRYWSELFQPPTADCRNSPFGVKRFHNGVFSGRFHGGVDLRSPQGRPVYAAAGGIVRISNMFRLHGGTIGIDHGQGVTSLYLHLSKVVAPIGSVVKTGDLVGYVGSTGFATGPHLHWALNVHGVAVQPEQWTGPLKRCVASPN
ncbi:MAG TPA: M23 family metallopeptidase [Bryobacteraceae bacterium]|nr:M23 family metallopeptidase [Bryobacteraceae bacterium]